jgi:vanillate/3-O-methylgallate O-demethylase
MRTLVWNSDDVVDVYASLFRKGDHFQFMEIPRDQRGFMYADKVLKDGKVVGVATSRGYSYYFREMISLCTVDVACSEIGTSLTVIWGEPRKPQKEIRATLAPAPYKTDNRRADLRSIG